MTTRWILIANAERARLFAARGRTSPWQPVRELAHPDSAAKVSQLVSDRAGRVRQRVGARRSAADARTPPKAVEAERFARELTSLLHEGLGRHDYDRLVLVAPPHFLGLLRECASVPVREAITASVGRNWTSVAAADLPARLAAVLA